jgi:hypothetical protein
MPTGYTADVQSGKVTDFQTFALQCVRAFGALVMMRDAPSDAPIPEEFKPSDYSAKALQDATSELERLRLMTPSDVERAAAAAYDEALTRWAARRKERVQVRQRYEAMIAQVQAWDPPSQDHVEMKSFMLKQLRDSIDFDCSSDYDDRPVKRDSKKWHAQESKRLRESIAYHVKSHAEEVERTRGRNVWVRQLRESLKSYGVAQGAAK